MALASNYPHGTSRAFPASSRATQLLGKDEARRIAAYIAKLPELLGR